MKPIKSFFLPRTKDDNPYITQLISNLEKLGIQVETPSPSSSTTFFLPIVISGKTDIVHLNWLHLFFTGSNILESSLKLTVFITQLIILKIIGIKLIWTVHNLKNHENLNLTLDRICTILVANLADKIITHCEAAKDEVVKTFPLIVKDKIFVVPHGNYIECYENKIEKIVAQENIGFKNPSLVFLFLGMIRPYKGVFELIETFKLLNSSESRLIIAGKVYKDDPEMTNALVQKISDDQRIKFIPGFVAPNNIQLYMNASDVVVFPYRDILTSGAVMLAMSFSRACIAPRKGCIAEVLDDVGAFLYDIDDENGLIQAMNSALQHKSQLANMGQHNYRLVEKYNWKHIAGMIADVYNSCL